MGTSGSKGKKPADGVVKVVTGKRPPRASAAASMPDGTSTDSDAGSGDEAGFDIDPEMVLPTVGVAMEEEKEVPAGFGKVWEKRRRKEEAARKKRDAAQALSVPGVAPAQIRVALAVANEFGIGIQRTRAIAACFQAADVTREGRVRLDQVLECIGQPRTRFTERMMVCILGHDRSIKNRWLSFVEYLAAVYNVCTLEGLPLVQFLFGMFDMKCRGKLAKPEVYAIIRMLHNVDNVHHVPGALAYVDALFQGTFASLRQLKRAEAGAGSPSGDSEGGGKREEGGEGEEEEDTPREGGGRYPLKYCTPGQFLDVDTSFQDALLRPALDFTNAVRHMVDAKSCTTPGPWQSACAGRVRKGRFAAAFMKEVIARLGPEYQALVQPPALPYRGAAAYAHVSEEELSSKGMLFAVAGGAAVGRRNRGARAYAVKPGTAARVFQVQVPPAKLVELVLADDDRGVVVAKFSNLLGRLNLPTGVVLPGDVVEQVDSEPVWGSTAGEVRRMFSDVKGSVLRLARRNSIDHGTALTDAHTAPQASMQTMSGSTVVPFSDATDIAPTVVEGLTSDDAHGNALALSPASGTTFASSNRESDGSPVADDAPATPAPTTPRGSTAGDTPAEATPSGYEGGSEQAGEGEEDEEDAEDALSGDGGKDDTEEAQPAAGVEETKAGAADAPGSAPRLAMGLVPPLPPSRNPHSPSAQPTMTTFVFSVSFPGDSIGLKLVPTRRGIRVQGFTEGFDSELGRDITVGDYLVAVNNSKFATMSMESAMRVMQAETRPRVLKFVRFQQAKAPTRLLRYQATFTRGAIGLHLAQTQLGLRVRGMGEVFDAVEGASVQVGDVLVAVGDENLGTVALADLGAVMGRHPPPRTLTFVRPVVTEVAAPPQPPPVAVVFEVTFPKASVGLHLVPTRRGVVVKGFADGFDQALGKDVRVGDLLAAINGTSLAGEDIDGVADVIRATVPPRTIKFVRLGALPKPVAAEGAPNPDPEAAVEGVTSPGSHHSTEPELPSGLELAERDYASDYTFTSSASEAKDDSDASTDVEAAEVARRILQERFNEIELTPVERHRVALYLSNWKDDDSRTPADFELLAAWAVNDFGRILRVIAQARLDHTDSEQQRVSEAAAAVARNNLYLRIKHKATKKLYKGTVYNARGMYKDGTGLSEMVPSDSESDRSDWTAGSSDSSSDHTMTDEDAEGEESEEDESDGESKRVSEEASGLVTDRTSRETPPRFADTASEASSVRNSSEDDRRVLSHARGGKALWRADQIHDAVRRGSLASVDSVEDPFPDHPANLLEAIKSGRRMVRAARDWRLPSWAHEAYEQGVGKTFFRMTYKAALGRLECERFYQEARPPLFTVKCRRVLLELQRSAEVASRKMDKVWANQMAKEVYRAETAADSRMRHRFAVNETVNEQKKEEARQLLWLHKNWKEINPDATELPPGAAADFDLDKARDLVEKDDISAEVKAARKEVKKKYKKMSRQKGRVREYAEQLAMKTEARIRRHCGRIMQRRQRIADERDGIRFPALSKVAKKQALRNTPTRPPSASKSASLPSLHT